MKQPEGRHCLKHQKAKTRNIGRRAEKQGKGTIGLFTVETERLSITEFTPEMAQAVHENSLDAENRRFIPDEVFETEEEARETVLFLISRYEGQEGPLVYPVLLRDGTVIGHVQAIPLEDGQWEVGYHIGERYTRKGYATEALRAFLPAVMGQLGLKRILGICVAENLASRKVMEKCGFRKEYEGPGLYQGKQRDICRYAYVLPPSADKKD